jgi:membrane-bound lytic murein transglycosylase D
VSVDYAIDLRLVADVTGASLQEIVALNPSLLRMTTPRDMMFDLHLPIGTKDAYAERLKDIPEERRTSWRFHVVKPGETLDGIATALHGRANEIATANGVDAGQSIAVGDELVVPVATVTTAVKLQRYTVRRGETLVTVADRFNVSVDELRSWNKLRSSTVNAGQTLNVAAPVRLGPVTHVRAKKPRSAGSATMKRGSAKSIAKASSKTAATSSRGKSASKTSRATAKKKSNAAR